MVEYASITAALAVLVASLSGLVGSMGALPSNDLRATALVSAAARSHHVSSSEARGAYAKAPFRKPVLRYLYAVGWVNAASNHTACTTAELLGPDPRTAVRAALARKPTLLARLRTAHVTPSQAATALARGTHDGCA